MIPIRNVYYMLAYAFRLLDMQAYRDMDCENFSHIEDMFAAILEKGALLLIKRGMGKEYVSREDELQSPRGKYQIAESIKRSSLINHRLVCSYDEYTENCYMNQVLKSCFLLLLRGDLSVSRKKGIKKILPYFQNVDEINLYTVDWNFRYDRNNQIYRPLLNICYLLVKGMLQTNEQGKKSLEDYLDDQMMHRLYEKFILEYYRVEHPYLNSNPAQIKWQEDNGNFFLLPEMKTDITLRHVVHGVEKVMIIDAKYYSSNMSRRFEGSHDTLISGNMYQIFTYVKNKEAELTKADKPHVVKGMLLYAKTEREIQPVQAYKISGNEISVDILDLGAEFEKVREKLDAVAEGLA